MDDDLRDTGLSQPKQPKMSGTDAPPPPPQLPDTMPSGSMAEKDTTLFEGTPAEPQTAPPAEIIAE